MSLMRFFEGNLKYLATGVELFENSTVGVEFSIRKGDSNVAIGIIEESLCSILEIG